ncbi:MAG: SPOR domain-containing protein [Gemmatimonadaceae bacterium]
MTDPWTPRDVPAVRPDTPWEEVGRRLASALDDRSAAVIVADDPEAAAHVAIGIGRLQALRRRVAIGDLAGELQPLAELVPVDDADEQYGISDSFLYGVSLSRIARLADGSQNLFILPSGTEPVAVEEVLGHERWRRLAQGFESEGALLLLVAPADAPGLQTLVDSLDGAVILGGAGRNLADSTRVIALARAPHEGRMPAPRPAEVPRAAEPEPAPEAVEAPRWRWLVWAAAIVLILGLAAGIAALSGVFRSRSASREPAVDSARPAPAAPVTASTGAPTVAPVAAPAPDSVVVSRLTPSNPSDSAAAAKWAVELSLADSPEGARRRIAGSTATLPAATVSPAVMGPERARWYRVVVGAVATRVEAESLRADLRRQGVLLPEAGTIVRAPLALLLVPDVPAARTPAAMQPFEQRGLSPYVLVRPDGNAAVYAGAFATADDAAALAATVQRMGVAPVLAYRVGRAIP